CARSVLNYAMDYW
nr:immunoglobulin heavy chain junction region [Mus musculus]MBK4184657.1 immunoglobulin heavy chain junction region [Mus musculus]